MELKSRDRERIFFEKLNLSRGRWGVSFADTPGVAPQKRGLCVNGYHDSNWAKLARIAINVVFEKKVSALSVVVS